MYILLIYLVSVSTMTEIESEAFVADVVAPEDGVVAERREKETDVANGPPYRLSAEALLCRLVDSQDDLQTYRKEKTNGLWNDVDRGGSSS